MEHNFDPNKPIRHILGLSGGKDSTALALFMRDRVPQMEYVFTPQPSRGIPWKAHHTAK